MKRLYDGVSEEEAKIVYNLISKIEDNLKNIEENFKK
jgi:hypothetical protein